MLKVFKIVCPSFTSVAVRAQTPEEAARTWLAWRARNPELTIGRDITVLQVWDADPLVLSRAGKVVGHVLRPTGTRAPRAMACPRMRPAAEDGSG